MYRQVIDQTRQQAIVRVTGAQGYHASGQALVQREASLLGSINAVCHGGTRRLKTRVDGMCHGHHHMPQSSTEAPTHPGPVAWVPLVVVGDHALPHTTSTLEVVARSRQSAWICRSIIIKG